VLKLLVVSIGFSDFSRNDPQVLQCWEGVGAVKRYPHVPLKFAAELSLRDSADHQWDKRVVHFQYFVSCRGVSAPLFVTKDLTTDGILADTARDFTVFVLRRGASYTARWGAVNSQVSSYPSEAPNQHLQPSNTRHVRRMRQCTTPTSLSMA
jgi:hypothetical protein